MIELERERGRDELEKASRKVDARRSRKDRMNSKVKEEGWVPVVACWIHEDPGLIPGLAHRVKDLALR